MKIKGGGPRKSARPADEPNFYAMPYLPQANETKNKAVVGPATAGRKEPPVVVYQMPVLQQQQQQQHLQETARSSTGSVSTVLEQALAHQAYLAYMHRATTHQHQQQPLVQPPALTAVSMAVPADLQQTASLQAALREEELLTAALLQRLRR